MLFLLDIIIFRAVSLGMLPFVWLNVSLSVRPRTSELLPLAPVGGAAQAPTPRASSGHLVSALGAHCRPHRRHQVTAVLCSASFTEQIPFYMQSSNGLRVPVFSQHHFIIFKIHFLLLDFVLFSVYLKGRETDRDLPSTGSFPKWL